MPASPDASASRPTRRGLLVGAAAGAGVVAGLAVERSLHRETSGKAARDVPPPHHGAATVPFFGIHQAGIATPAQAHAAFVGIDLLPEVGRDGVMRLMRLLTDDAARLTQGEAALADTEPELAGAPANLTVTFGFSPGLLSRIGLAAPAWAVPLPSFSIDRLVPEHSDGELLLQVASDDPLTLSHTLRMLVKDTRSFGGVRWLQHGFRRAYGSVAPETTMRNLFGQVDGTTNLRPGTTDFDKLVWRQDGVFAGGTSMVLRRIRMDLDEWDRVDRVARETAVGRFLADGAPLTGGGEHDEADFAAQTALGFPVIPDYAHIRRARSENPNERFFRRGYNYETAPGAGQVGEAGLLFATFQADIGQQFVPIQQRLDELDFLNVWTTPVGSAVFVIPPGCAAGGYIGEQLLS